MSWEEEMSCGATKYTSRPQKTALQSSSRLLYICERPVTSDSFFLL